MFFGLANVYGCTPLSSLLAGVSTEVARREAMMADRFSIA
jgi:hypothetical protein